MPRRQAEQRSRDGPPDHVAAGAARTGIFAEWPLIGRTEEVRLAWQRLDVPGPPPVGVVIAGAAGIGKTRLARTLAGHAQRRRWARLDATATHSSASIAFGALAHLLPRAPDPGPLPPIDVLTRAKGHLSQGAAGRRVLLTVDDAHLLDEASATLIQQLAATGEVAVALTLRSREPIPDAIRTLWKDHSLARFELQPLSRDQVEELLERVLGSSPDAPTRQLLWRASLGNVFLLRELVLGGIVSRRLSKIDRVWRWDGELAAPPSLIEMLTEQINTLAAADRVALETIAVGEPLPVSAIERLGIGPAVAALERRGMLLESRQGDRDRVLLSHPLYGEALRAMTPPEARRDHQHAIGAALLSGGTLDGDDTLRIARWQLESGRSVSAKLLLDAARHAAALPDHVLAERLSRAANRAGSDPASRLLLVQSLRGQARWQEAIDLCATDLDAYGPALRARFAVEHAHARFFGLHDPVGAMMLLDAATVFAPPDQQDACLSLRAVIALFAGDVATAEQDARRIATHRTMSPEVRARALLCLVAALAVNGETSEAVQTAHAIDEELSGRPGIPAIWHAQLLFSLATALRLAGQVDEAVHVTSSYYSEGAGSDPGTAGFAALSYGESLLAAGRAHTAADVLVESRALMRRVDAAGLLPLAVAAAAHANALARAFTVADELAAEAAELTRRLAPVFMPQLVAHLAWVFATRGEQSRAREQLTNAASQAANTGQYALEANVLHDLVRLDDAGTAAQRLATLCRRIRGPLAPVLRDHARATLTRDGTVLGQVAESFAACGTHLLAAEAAGQAARAHAATGHLSLAYAAQQLADHEASLCESCSTPLLEHARDLVQLTSREREISALAAAGRSNRQIANDLGLSARTVEGHLQQVYTKLGISSRTELPTTTSKP